MYIIYVFNNVYLETNIHLDIRWMQYIIMISRHERIRNKGKLKEVRNPTRD